MVTNNHCLMMSLWFGKILLQEAEECIGTTRSICRLARSCHDLGSCRFCSVICGELCGKVGGNGRGDGSWWQSVRLHDSDMCIFGLGKLSMTGGDLDAKLYTYNRCRLVSFYLAEIDVLDEVYG